MIFAATWRAIFWLIKGIGRLALLPWVWTLAAKLAAPVCTFFALRWLNSPESLSFILTTVAGLAAFFPNQVIKGFWKLHRVTEVWRANSGLMAASEASSPSMPESPLYGTPAPRVELSPREAEKLVQEWLVYLGFVEAQVTQYSQDGGVDVLTDEFAVQVKRWRNGNNLGVRDVRELYGVATKLKKSALFFITSDVSSAAMKEANELCMPIIRFAYLEPKLTPLNPAARSFLSDERSCQDD